jgi:HTH-type transcriptional regulator / antitoxin HigA
MTHGSNPSYIELLKTFPPRTITSEEQFCETQQVIDALIDKGDLTPDEEEYLDLLGTLVYAYEAEHVPMPELRGVDLIRVCLSERNLRQKDLIPIFKTESIVSAVLNGRRKLTVEHIRKLSKFFKLPPELFLESNWADEEEMDEGTVAEEIDETAEPTPSLTI